MQQIDIRPIRPEDAEQAADLIVERMEFEAARLGWRSLTAEERQQEKLRRIEQLTPIDKYHTFYVAEIGVVIAGCGGLEYITHEPLGPQHSEYRRLEERAWFVHPKHVGKKVGRRIYERLLEDAIKTGEEYLYVQAANFPSTSGFKGTIDIYRELGFVEHAALWFDGRNPVMRKRLNVEH